MVPLRLGCTDALDRNLYVVHREVCTVVSDNLDDSKHLASYRVDALRNIHLRSLVRSDELSRQSLDF